ncbi:MAG: oxidoreductase [Verrucomicrobiota bacterium]
MFNGYDRDRLTRECPFPGIPAYLNQVPAETLTIPGATVTNICCTVDGGFTAEHVERCRPFIAAGLPVFVDKPLTDNAPDLRVFQDWIAAGKQIMSSNCMRYAKEFAPYRASTSELGALRFVSITTPKSWERYGIHALESNYPILGPGFLSARNIVHLKHRCGADVVVMATGDMAGSFGCLQLCATAGHTAVAFGDSYFAFKAQLVVFIEFLRTGVRPFPFAETSELMRLVIAGIRSRNEGGREVLL